MSVPGGDLTGAIARVRAATEDTDATTTTLRPVQRASSTGYSRRRGVELFAVSVAWALGVGGFLAVGVGRLGHLPDRWPEVAAAWAILCLVAHLVVRWRAPYADPVILPCVLALNGLGLTMIYRLDLYWAVSNAPTQSLWTIVALVGFTALLLVLHDYRVLQRYPYVLFLVGLGLLLLPLVPGLGVERGGSRIWIHLAGYSFQPAEVAKIVLALAFASYLADRREMLRHAGRRLGPLTLPRLRDLVPVLIMWGASLVILVFQNDLGTSLLFFGLFVMMLYVATDQVSWVLIGLALFAAAAFLVYTQTSHVQARVDGWLHPFANRDRNDQIIQAQYGLAWGGLLGRGWGAGAPGRVPLANSDFISAALGEELGLVGLSAVVLLYAVFVERTLRAALVARDSFGKLLATGLGFVIALQVFAIIGGVTRLLPLTGLTTPFLSQGGSSLLANWLIVALLLQLSHQARRPLVETEPAPIVELDEAEAAQVAARSAGVVETADAAPLGPVEAPPPATSSDAASTVLIRVPAAGTAADTARTELIAPAPTTPEVPT